MADEEAPMPDKSTGTITVLTASAEKRFTADSFDVDDNGYLSVRREGKEVAKYSPAAWQGVHHSPAASEPSAA